MATHPSRRALPARQLPDKASAAFNRRFSGLEYELAKPVKKRGAKTVLYAVSMGAVLLLITQRGVEATHRRDTMTTAQAFQR